MPSRIRAIMNDMLMIGLREDGICKKPYGFRMI